MLFKRELRIEEVMYALYEQIQYKGLAFYVLKSERKPCPIQRTTRSGS